MHSGKAHHGKGPKPRKARVKAIKTYRHNLNNSPLAYVEWPFVRIKAHQERVVNQTRQLYCT